MLLAEKAKVHVENVEVKYRDAIRHSINSTIIWSSDIYMNSRIREIPVVRVEDIDSAGAVMEGDGKKQCVLNFASFTMPGGGFMEGSMAQEEALCHASTLYPVLASSYMMKHFYGPNRQYVNHGLYHDILACSKDIVFMDGEKEVLCDVITCAAPNRNAAMADGVPEQDNRKYLYSRIGVIMDFLSYYAKPDRVILGAFGCGVFGQDPYTVAKAFKESIDIRFWDRAAEIVFAVPKQINGRSTPEVHLNNKAFCDVFGVQEA